MIEEDIAKDNLRSCSQQTHYLFDWTQSVSNPTPPLQIRQAKKTFRKISSQISPDFQFLQTKAKRKSIHKIKILQEPKQQIKKIMKERPKQKRQQVLCRFQYPLIDQTDQTLFWTKYRQEENYNKKIQSVSKHSLSKKLTDLVEQQIKKNNIRKLQEYKSKKVSTFEFKNHYQLTAKTLPIINKRKIKLLVQQQYKNNHILIDTTERQQSALKRRTSMPIIKYKYKF